MLQTRTQVARAATRHSTAVPGHKRGVLIVDDEPMLVEEMGEFLQADGYPVTLAHDGQQALTIFHQSPPGRFAVVLTDLRMPGITGFALASAILRLAPRSEAVEVIVITGQRSARTLAGVPDGLFAVMQKPVRLSGLAEVVAQAHDVAVSRRMAAAAETGSLRTINRSL